MFPSSRPNRLSTKHAVISLLILSGVVMGLLLPIHQVVQAQSVTLTIFCDTDYIIVRNDGLVNAIDYPFTLTKDGNLVISSFMTVEAGLTYNQSLTAFGYGEFEILIYDTFNTYMAGKTCTRSEPTFTPTTTNTPQPKPLYNLSGDFDGLGNAVFIIHNYGDSMIFDNRYILYKSGTMVDQGLFTLFNGGNKTVTYAGDPGNYLLNIVDQNSIIVAHTTLNNIPATSTSTPTSTSTSTTTFTLTFTPTSTSSPTSTSTSTSTTVHTLVPTKTSTSAFTQTLAPSNDPNNTLHPGQTPTAGSWFWFKPRKTPTLAVTVTPTLRTTLAGAQAVSSTQTQTSTPMATASTPVEPVKPAHSLAGIFIAVGVLLLALIGFGLRRMFLK